MNDSKNTYYDTLGVEKNASLEEIAKAYLICSQKLLLNQDSKENYIKKLNELKTAYQLLSDIDSRYLYDQLENRKIIEREEEELKDGIIGDREPDIEIDKNFTIKEKIIFKIIRRLILILIFSFVGLLYFFRVVF